MTSPSSVVKEASAESDNLEDEKKSEAVVEEEPLISSAQSEAPKSLHEWGKDPVVKRTLEIFNGDLLEVKEPS